MAVPNLISNTSVKNETEIQAVGTGTPVAIVGAVTSGETWFVDLSVCNIHASAASWISVYKYNGATDYALVMQMGIPLTQTLVMPRIHLEEGWSLRLTAGAGSTFTAVADVEKWA